MRNRLDIRWIVCVLLLLGGTDLSAQYGTRSSSWGNNGYVNDYYYGQQSAFQLDDNMFNYGSSALQGMGSTSTYAYGNGAFYTAASSIESGSTLADYAYSQIASRMRGRDDHQWETDDVAPIGDGWDVMLLLLLLALGYGVYVYRRPLRGQKSDRFAVGS